MRKPLIPHALRQMQAWIMDHPAEDFRIEAIAERMAMSPRNFARVFLTETGMTPAKFVARARIDAARYYLESTELPIETVAEKSGFRDPERMRRTFHRLLGVSAQDYRARFKSATRHDVTRKSKATARFRHSQAPRSD